MAKLYTLTIRNRAAIAIFAVGVFVLGAIFLTVGLALLAGLAVAGGVLGAGYAAVRRLRGGRGQPIARSTLAQDGALDPALEIRPVRPAIVSSIEDPPK